MVFGAVVVADLTARMQEEGEREVEEEKEKEEEGAKAKAFAAARRQFRRLPFSGRTRTLGRRRGRLGTASMGGSAMLGGAGTGIGTGIGTGGGPRIG